MQGLAPVDVWAVVAIMAKACGYATGLVAMGAPLFLLLFEKQSARSLAMARRVLLIAIALGLAALAIRVGIRAGRISGMGVAGMFDKVMLGVVWNSPLGSVVLLRGAGYLCVLAALLPNRLGPLVGVLGSIALAGSFTQIGHLSDATWLLTAFLVVHLITAGFWFAALMPLMVETSATEDADLLHKFGQVASVTVPILLVAGLGLAWHLSGGLAALFGTAYGVTLVAKVVGVCGLLLLAAVNKLRLVPALVHGDATARPRLRTTIKIEILVMLAILFATATLTTITTPPIRL